MRVQLAGVARSRGAQTILDEVTLTIGAGARLGLVGPNGVGKTTLLRLAAGLDEPDAGTVTRVPPSLTVGYLPQERDARPDETLLAYLRRRTGVAAAEADLERTAAALGGAPGGGDAYASALDRFLALGGGDLEARAGIACADLGLDVALDRPAASLSGGQSARVALAAILLSRFDVLLLDEPTNDLDFDGLARLERFLQQREGGLAVVSHDRELLDRTVTRIVEIDPGTRRVREWAGGWSDYARAREHERRRAYERFEQAEERRREVEALLQKRRSEARARGGTLAKETGGADRRGTHALSTKVRQAERAMERVDEAAKPFEPWELRLSLDAAERGGDTLAELRGAVAVRGAFRLGPIDLAVAPGDRIAVTGRNGSGKSTLLALLLGELPLAGGKRYVGRRTTIGCIGQARSAYGGDEPLLEVAVARTGLAAVDARTLLAKFGLGTEHVHRPWARRATGERTRAHLAELQARGVNLLVLDEPTNHLDLEAVEQLEAAVASYRGALVVVSHDRRFLAAIGPSRELPLPAAARGVAGSG